MFTTCRTHAQPLTTVAFVDINRYCGRWYEIASIPQRFQNGCSATTADYSLSNKGYIIVENRCNRGAIHPKISSIKGKAYVVKNSGNAKLRVQFFWPFTGKYWIIELADDYSYAVVGHPNRKYLWILSRTPTMPIGIYSEVLEKIRSKGYDISRIVMTCQK
jgi:apolipoprotein D and lipocalin family protein